MATSDRLRLIGRRVLPWLVGPAALILRGRLFEIVPPAHCPGLIESISIAVVRQQPDWPPGQLFVGLQMLVIVAGLAAFVALVSRATGNSWVAAATGLAVGVSPLFAKTIAPPADAAVFALSSAGALLLDRVFVRTTDSRLRFVAGAVLFAIAAIVPAWTMVAAGAIAGLAWCGLGPRSLAAKASASLAAFAGVVVLSGALLNVSPPDLLTGASSWPALVSCGLPFQHPRVPIADLAWTIGPLVFGLALLGFFVTARTMALRMAVVGTVVVMLAAAAGAAPGVRIALAPAAIGIWWLAAVGLNDVIAAIKTPYTRRAVTVGLACLIPVLQTARSQSEERDDWVRPRGHERITLRQTTAMLNLVVPGAVLVQEDSVMDVLLRAATVGRRRAAKPFTVMPRQPDAIRKAMISRPVYAFPDGQAELSHRGFTIVPMPLPAGPGDRARETIDGLAAITAVRRCQTVDGNWMDLTGVAAGGRLAFAADRETATGPVILYLGGSSPAVPYADGWPGRATRGFQVLTFDQRDGQRSDSLRSEAREAGLPDDHPVLGAPFVERLVLHRTPRAPLTLAVVLGASFPLGVARLEYPQEAGHVNLCDAPVVTIAPLGSRP